MDGKDIIKKLLSLSEALLKATTEEEWAAWERIIKQKLMLYKKLEKVSKGIFDQNGKEGLHRLKTLEDRIIEELLNKREQTKQAILQIKMNRKGWEGYRKEFKSPPRRHFNIHC